MKKKRLAINDYMLNIKNFGDALSSIGAPPPPKDDDLVSTVLNGIDNDKQKPVAASFYGCEKFPNIQGLIYLMITKEVL